MKKLLLFITTTFCSVLIFTGCSNSTNNKVQKSDEESVLPILYQQQAGEYRALCLQAYQLAREPVDLALQFKGKHKPWAVITDLDETALDNSESEAWLYQHDSTANLGSLKDWWLAGKAKAVPGSVEFFQYAKSNGVHIYYISNRQDTVPVINSTRINMRHLGFPYTDTTDNNHFLFQGSKSPASKETRRNQVTATDSVIVLLGDNLIDLDKTFDKVDKKYQANELRDKEVNDLKGMWGVRYIVFPNAIYGDWESSFYQSFSDSHNGKSPSMAQKDSIRNTFLRPYKE